MKTRSNGGLPEAQRPKSFHGEGPNWVLIAGGALLSTLSMRLGYKLKQALDGKQSVINTSTGSGNGKSTDWGKNSEGCRLHSNAYSFVQNDGSCCNCISGNEAIMESSNGQTPAESEHALPLVTVASPDRPEFPPKAYHHPNYPDSPSVSDSGSDIFSKREVIHKLRQQLKRRDDMILEMQDRIAELQSSLSAQSSVSAHLRSQLDAAGRELFDSEREIQRLRKAIADHCAGPDGKPVTNGHAADGYFERVEGEKVERLKGEVRELKEVIEGKEYLLQSYKEQKMELSVKVKELQRRLDSQLPNIL